MPSILSGVAITTSAKAEVMRSSQCVCHSVRTCLSLCLCAGLKLNVMIAPTSRNDWLTCDGDLVSWIGPTDSGLLFPFPYHCGIGDFHDTRRNDWRRQANESTTFGINPADIRIGIQINPGIRSRIPDHFKFLHLLIAKLKLQYFGHITRGSAGQLTLTVLEGIMEGLRHQGRPRRQWIVDTRHWRVNWLWIHSAKGDVTRSSTMEKKYIGMVICCRQPSSRKVD